MQYPYFQEIQYQSPLRLFQRFASEAGAVFLESAKLMEGCGRYSFIGVDPFYILKHDKNLTQDPLTILKKELAKFPLEFHSHLPPFQGGVMGYFSYEMSRYFENLPHTIDEMQFPYMVMGFYDLVIAFDHVLKRAWIFSSGYPMQDSSEREKRAVLRFHWLNNLLQKSFSFKLSQHPICELNAIQSNFTSLEYEEAVKRIKNYILAGDIFQANLAQRFKTFLPKNISPFELYQRLHFVNPAPFSAFLNFNDGVIASASPERFLQCINREVETRPIKGTLPRGKTSEEDFQLSNKLLNSQKDKSENVMIVDLLRNDLSRVCENFSVKVPQLCGLESYATVHHLVSVVKGKLKSQHDVIDLLRATFPGGSITGAPKIRAMEIISELEKISRGPYCGSIAYIGFNGDLDSSITIRTFSIKNNIISFHAGGAIVADSDPVAEYVETLTKAKALMTALTEFSEAYDIIN